MTIVADSSKMDYAFVMVHDRGLVFPTDQFFYGADAIFPNVNDHSFDGDNVVTNNPWYVIKREKHVHLDRSVYPCLKEEDYRGSRTVSECYQEYVDRVLGCQLPWRKNSKSFKVNDNFYNFFHVT